MYYKSINRGLAFTKAGLYLFSLILFIGMLAVITGVNAFYLILCSSLGIFVVSGIISEQVLKSCFVRCSIKGILNANSSFEMSLFIENRSRVTFYGLEQIVLTQYPKYRLLSRPMETALGSSVVDLPARSSKILTVIGKGLKRGVYDNLIILQQTQAPFGLLEKYRFSKDPVKIVVAPQVDEVFLSSLNRFKNMSLKTKHDGAEFFGHKPMNSVDKRNLDWKKNVQKPVNQWVVKVYKEQHTADSIEIVMPWSVAENCIEDVDYEQYLSSVRTMLFFLERRYKFISLNLGKNRISDEPKVQLEILAQMPSFNARKSGPYWKPEWEKSQKKGSYIIEFESKNTFKFVLGDLNG